MSIKYKSDVVIVVSILAVVIIAVFMRTNISGDDITGKAVTNHAPVFKPMNSQTVQVGKTIRFDVEATDADSDRITYSNGALAGQGVVISSSDITFGQDAGKFSWRVGPTTKLGDYYIRFSASDYSNDGKTPKGGKTAMIVKIIVTSAQGASTSLLPASASPSYSRYVWQTEDNGKYTKVGLSRDSGGNIVCDILNYTDGSQACKDKYADSNLVLGTCESNYYSTKIGCSSTVGNKMAKKCDCALSSSGLTGTQNRPPVFDPVEIQTVQPRQKLEFVISATDPNGPVTYAILNDPLVEGQTFNPQTKTFSWDVPSNPKYYYYTLLFTATDNKGVVSILPVIVEIQTQTTSRTTQNRPPTITNLNTVPPGTGLVKVKGSRLTFIASDSDTDGRITSRTWLKNGLNINCYSNRCAYTFNDVGPFLIEYIVVDDKGATAYDSISVEILGEDNVPTNTQDYLDAEICSLIKQYAIHNQAEESVIIIKRNMKNYLLTHGCNFD